MKRRQTTLARALALFAAAGSLAASGVAATQEGEPTGEESIAVETRRGPTDAAEVKAFLAGIMAAHMEDHDIVGATVAVVRDGGLLFSAGYGYADKEKREPVDAERTLFRIGSVSKLFTWTAVMQQVEAGRLDLNTDVNEYLDFEIPATYPEPITLSHLLTHTPGFEDRAIALFGATELSRRDYLEKYMPARVRPAGTFSAYSNYGTTLAGHIVERVTGTSWEDYIDERILEPLGMQFATGQQPLPERLAPHMSAGYAEEKGEPVAKEFEMIGGQAPAGSVSASAGAMAKFMIAHLRYGEYAGQRILGEETARRMYSRLFGHDDRLPGIAHGFYEQTSHGLRIIGHGGDTRWFHTDLAISHEEDFGVFVSYNTASGGQLSFRPFLEAFLDHFYPVSDEQSSLQRTASELERHTGEYRMNRAAFTTIEKSLGLFASVAISAADDGRLVVVSPLGRVLFAPLDNGSGGSDLFHEVDGTDLLTFREDGSGRTTHAFLGSLPFIAMVKVGPLQSPSFHRTLLIVVLVLYLLTFFALPVRALMVRRFSEMRADSPQERRARWIAWSVALSNLALVIGLAVLMSDLTTILAGSFGGLRIVLGFGVLAALATIGVIACAVLAWKNRYWTAWGRLRYSLFAALSVAYLLVLNYWNLLGWKLG